MKKSLIYSVIAAGVTIALVMALVSTPLVINHPPDVTISPNKEILAGSSVILGADKIVDEDGDPLSYSWTQLSGEQVLLFNSNSSNPNFSMQPGTTNKTLSFQLDVSDGKTTKSTVVNVVILANRPPIANAGEDDIVDRNTEVALDGSQSYDPEKEAISYKWAQVGGPAVELSDASVANPTFTVPPSSAGKTLTFQLIVNDGMADSKPDTVKLTVKPDKPPVANAGPDQTYSNGEVVILSGLASYDSENDKLTYKWTQTSGPDVKLSDPRVAKPTFIAPASTTEKALVFQLVVNDGAMDSIPDTVKITIRADRTPVARAGPDRIVGAETLVTLDATVSSDPDGRDLAYLWKQTGGPAVKLSDPRVAKPTFEAPAVKSDTNLTFQLTVSDGTSDSTDTVIVTVKPNKPPVANAGLDRDVIGESQVTLDGSKSSDPENQKLTYRWKQTGGPAVVLSNANSTKPTFKAPTQGTTDKVLTFQLVVSDGTSDSTDTVVITVKTNRAPVANAGPDRTVRGTDDIVLDGSKSTDPDGDDISYEWKQISGTSVTLKYSKSAQAVFRAPDVSKSTVLTFQLTASDGKLSKTDVVQITVRPA